MNARSLRAVLTHAAAHAADGGATDGELVARFAADRDAAAFAELVRRYGRLVWAVCRQTLPNEADAEDAFQATFLALVTSAGTVRKTATLAPWLHGVAYRVATKAKRSAARRHRRETIAASAEADAAVPGSAWDAALAAVHAAVAELPDYLRTPFVLCCLEGHGPTDAAARLGWKLGTLSGRLTRAKQAVLDHLAKRGLPVGAAVALVTTVGPPAAVAARAAALPLCDAIPRSISILVHGASGMSMMTRTKLLAAAVLAAGGLATGWQATTVAQDSTPPAKEKQAADTAKKAAEPPAGHFVPLTDHHTDMARYMHAVLAEQSARANRTPSRPPQWEYDFSLLANAPGQPVGETAAEYRRVFHQREDEGWEYVGTTPLDSEVGKGIPAMVFRRPAKAKVVEGQPLGHTVVEGQPLQDAARVLDKLVPDAERRRDEMLKYYQMAQRELTEKQRAAETATPPAAGGPPPRLAPADDAAAVAQLVPYIAATAGLYKDVSLDTVIKAVLELNSGYKPVAGRYGMERLKKAVQDHMRAPAAKPAPMSKEHVEELALPGDVVSKLDPGTTLVNVPVAKEKAAGGALRVGDYVDVVLTARNASGSGDGTRTGVIARQAKVVMKRNALVPAVAGDPAGQPVWYGLQLNPYRAALVEYAMAASRGDFALRAVPAAARKPGPGGWSDPTTAEYADEDRRVERVNKGEYAVGDADIARVLKAAPPKAVPADRDPEHLRAEIARLQALLPQAERAAADRTVVVPPADVSNDPEGMRTVLRTLAKGSKALSSLTVTVTPAGLELTGDPTAIEWAKGVIAAASGKSK